MAEPRRVHLTTLSCAVPAASDGPAAARKPPAGLMRREEKGPDRPAETGTVRLVLTLFEPDDDRSFPEFSYSQLTDHQLRRLVEDEVPLGRFEEEEMRENEAMAALARKFEEKYCDKPKKKKDRIQDLIDIGYGYDDEDSFIDNTEAYDEFVPASITTKFGGFYVNSGVLQFRQASDTEDFPTEEKTPKPSKKRKRNRPDKPKKKYCRDDEEMTTNVDAKSSTLSENVVSDELKKKKKKKSICTLSVTSMLKKFQKEKERERQKMEKANEKVATVAGATRIPLLPADAAGGGGSGLTDPLLSLIGSTNDHALIQAASTVDFDIDLDSLLDVTEETSLLKSFPQAAAETQLQQPKTDCPTQSAASSDAGAPSRKTNSLQKLHPEQIQLVPEASSTLPHQCPPLPEGLPPQLEDRIRELMLAAKTSEGESKLKFFTPEVNAILLDIEFQCREQGGQLRSKVYTHLSSFVPCSRDTLLKRVKKLFVTNAEDPIQKLKEAVGRAMPEQIACFHETCQAHEQIKTSKAAEEGKDGTQKLNVGPEDNVEDKGGKRGGPKKLFKWNDEIRGCLCEVLKTKIDKYKKERKGSQELEENLKMLLDNEVKSLWPKGWMQSRVLISESRRMLGLFPALPLSMTSKLVSNMSSRVKKARTEKKPSSISGAPIPSESCSILQGDPPMKTLLQETTDVFVKGSNISSSMPLVAAQEEFGSLKNAEGKTRGGAVLDAGPSKPAETDKPLVTDTSAGNSVLDVLADQTPDQQQLLFSQELLAAAVAKYKRSVQQRRSSVDSKAPLFPPPPPPQSSPVSFQLSGLCQVVFPLLPQDFNRIGDTDEVHIISDDDDDDVTIIQ